MADNTDEQHNSYLSDSSFVILGQGSLPPSSSSFTSVKPEYLQSLKNNPIPSTSNGVDEIQDTNSNIHSSWGSDMSSHDIQTKLDQLLKENYQLKETLNQNNLAMKTQFETLVMWQQEVFKTHQNHKQKFSETKDLVLRLKAENATLKKHIEEGTSKSQVGNDSVDLGQENLLLKHKVDDLQQKLLLQSKCENSTSKKELELQALVEYLKSKLESTEQICRHLGSSNEILIIDKNKLDEKCKKAEQELLKLQSELQESVELNRNLQEKCTDLERKLNDKALTEKGESPSSLLPNSEARAQISNLFKQLEDERSKVSKLRELLNEKTSSMPINSTSSQLGECIHQLEDMTLSFDKQNERFCSMSSWLCLAEENVTDSNKGGDNENRMKAEIALLKKHLSQEQAICQEKREKLQEMQKQFEKLLDDYEELQNQWKKVEKKSSQEEESLLTQIQNDLRVKDELLVRKEKECAKLKQNVKKLQLECEEVGILRAQVDLYQSDFNAEREARQKAVGEKEEMAEKMRLLQREVQELEKELSDRTKTSFASDSSSAAAAIAVAVASPAAVSSLAKANSKTETGNRKVSQVETVSNEEQFPPIGRENTEASQSTAGRRESRPYQCPKCFFRFFEIDECERHVDKCLDLYMLP